MLIVLNGYPGVGKLTIGRVLAGMLDGRLLDNHSVYNVAFSLTEFRSSDFYEAVTAVQAVADDFIERLPADVPLILTEALAGDGPWGRVCWDRITCLARTRGPLFVVHILCAQDENSRRMVDPGRDEKRKPRSVEMVRRNHENAAVLLGGDAANLLRLDVTAFLPDQSAQAIRTWIDGIVDRS